MIPTKSPTRHALQDKRGVYDEAGGSSQLATRRGALGALSGLGALGLAACGGGGSDTATTATTSTPTVAADAALSGLSLSVGSLTPDFASSTLGYTLAVSNSTTQITLSPTLSSSGASVKINGVDVSSGQSSSVFALSVGNNSFTVVVTAADGSSKSYIVVVNRASALVSADASLSALSISTGSLSPAFVSGTTSYAVTVGSSVSSVTLTPTATSGAATLKVNGTTVSSGTASGALALNTGNNSLVIVATAQDGVTTTTTTVTVVRQAASLTSDATLSALAVSSGSLSPVFASGTLGYAVSVPNTVTSVTLTPTATNAVATIKINSVTVASGSASGALSLNVGSNALTVVVSAPDGTTVSTYTVAVTRAAALSNVATLSNLTVSSGTLSPSFSAGTLSYSASVANAVSSITVTPTTTSSAATVKVNGVAVSSGSASGSTTLLVGSNTLTLVVTAQDGSTTSTYTLIVTRAAASLSSVASLSALVLSSGTLSPVFATGTAAYTASVDNAVSSVTLTPTASNANATIKVNSASVTSGGASGALALVVGSNVLSVLVTAQDGATTRTYTVTLSRAASAVVASCPAGAIPEETSGPYPADGSTASGNTYNVLALSGIVRSDIRYTLGSSTPVSGVLMTVNISLVNLSNNCAPLSGYAVYLWHCTAAGVYSVYTESSVNSNYLSGVQAADANGLVTFTTVVPGCYAGRMPHMHFEIYPTLAQATSATNKIKTSQLAFPTATMQAIYAAASGYGNSVSNLNGITFATDNVFSDGYSLEMVSLTGSASSGYVATVTVGIAL